MIPAIIQSAKTVNGQVMYEVITDTWNGILERDIVVDNRAISAAAVQTFRDELVEKIR